MANGYEGPKISPKHPSHEQTYHAKSISCQSQDPKTIDNIVSEAPYTGVNLHKTTPYPYATVDKTKDALERLKRIANKILVESQNGNHDLKEELNMKGRPCASNMG